MSDWRELAVVAGVCAECGLEKGRAWGQNETCLGCHVKELALFSFDMVSKIVRDPRNRRPAGWCGGLLSAAGGAEVLSKKVALGEQGSQSLEDLVP